MVIIVKYLRQMHIIKVYLSTGANMHIDLSTDFIRRIINRSLRANKLQEFSRLYYGKGTADNIENSALLIINRKS